MMLSAFFFFHAEDGCRARVTLLEFSRVLFRPASFRFQFAELPIFSAVRESGGPHFGAIAERVDPGARDVDVRLRKEVGDARKQAGPVAGDNFEDEVRALVVGESEGNGKACGRGRGEVWATGRRGGASTGR